MENTNYNIERFYAEHKAMYKTALAEIKSEKKSSHWIWYIFPQMKFLGMSPPAKYYGIDSTEEAKAYYNDPYLGEKLREICHALLECKSSDPLEIMGHIDRKKLRSSMTLFYIATGDELFQRVLDKFYHGIPDKTTVDYINKMNSSNESY